MESFGDKLRAFGLALAVHIVCILAMLIGLWWTTSRGRSACRAR